MLRLHHNRPRQESHRSRKRSTILAGVLAGVFGAGIALTAATSLGSGAGAASAAPKDNTTVIHKGIPIPGMYSTYMPRLACPASHPYVLDEQYNTNTSFRLGPGIEFTDWRSGFDANVNFAYIAQPGGGNKGYVRTGLNGAHLANNTATFWAWFTEKTNWTLNLHCTNNPDRASYQSYP